jgi:hypothetical protein
LLGLNDEVFSIPTHMTAQRAKGEGRKGPIFLSRDDPGTYLRLPTDTSQTSYFSSGLASVMPVSIMMMVMVPRGIRVVITTAIIIAAGRSADVLMQKSLGIRAQ